MLPGNQVLTQEMSEIRQFEAIETPVSTELLQQAFKITNPQGFFIIPNTVAVRN